MNLGVAGGLISLLTGLILAIGSLVTIRARRLSREASELRELRETNIAAMGYIYDLESAMTEAMAMYKFKTKLEKPDVLKRSYIEKQAETTQNSELEKLGTFLQALSHSPPKPLISGEKHE